VVIQTFCPAQTSVHFGRKVTRNPLLHIASAVMAQYLRTKAHNPHSAMKYQTKYNRYYPANAKDCVPQDNCAITVSGFSYADEKTLQGAKVQPITRDLCDFYIQSIYKQFFHLCDFIFSKNF